MIAKRIKKFHSIDPRSWEHPADTAALSALKQLKGLDEVARIFFSTTTERSLRLMVLASSVKVSANQYPRIYEILDRVVDTFDWDYRPDVFVTQSPFLNAGVLGVKEPFIIINSSVVKNFDEAEVTAMVAHEMAHIMSGHSLYKTLIWMLTKMALTMVPVGDLVIKVIRAALSEWNRKSELTADRAEILALQDETPSYNILMRMAGAEDLSQVNLNEFFAQAREYEDQKGLLDGIHKFFNELYLAHPYPVVRLQELRTWVASGHYQSILDGNYLRREFVKADVKEDLGAGYEYYRETIRSSGDELSKYANEIGSGIEKAAGEIGDRLKGLFSQAAQPPKK
jgi:Zn-dependent protease with chaperone function